MSGIQEKNKYEGLAPVVVFGYNRPKHLNRCLELLAQNEEAINTPLYVFIDKAKSESAIAKNKVTTEVAQAFQWPGESKIVIERKENFGLARNIISGVSEIVKLHGRVVVVEDDLEVSPGFLKYMNDALSLYRKEESVMHVSGYMFPVNYNPTHETLFYQVTDCWGWGTWADSWNYLQTDPAQLLEQLKEKDMTYWFDLDGSGVFLPQLEQNISGKMRTWAIKWQASVNLCGGLSLHPSKTLVRNTGFGEESAHNTSSEPIYSNQEIADQIKVEPIELKDDPRFRQIMIDYYKSRKPGLTRRIVNKLKRITGVGNF